MNRLFRFTATILIFALITGLAYVTVAIPLDEPLLYYNDSTWAREDRSPLKIIDGEEYVPLTLFAQMKNTKVRLNESLNTFVITHSALYISIDASTNIAKDHSDKLYTITTYKLDYGERYVPAEVICRHVGLGFDSFENPVTGEIAVRITDGTEELSFEKLLEKHNPDLLNTESATEAETTEKPSDVTPPDSEDSQKLPGWRTVYITFPDPLNTNTEAVLDTLNAYGYKGTFFVDKNDIINNTLLITRIISEGHQIGIKSRSAAAYTSIYALIDELNSINKLLYRVFKIQTRSIMLDVMYTYNYDVINAVNSNALQDAGYSVWKANAERADGYYHNEIAYGKMVDVLWQNNVVVFNFGSNYSTPYVLNSTLSFIYRNRYYCDVRMARASFIPPIR